MQKWIAFVFIAVVCLAGCAEQNYPAYGVEIPETPPEEESIPYVLEHLSRRIRLHHSLWATPDNIVRSVDELHEFAETFIFSYWPSDRNAPYVIELMARFDDDFFEYRMLILSYVVVHGNETKGFRGISLRNEDTLHLRIGAYTPYWARDNEFAPAAFWEYVYFISLEHMDEITTIVRR
jgi:hypothetical protein